MSSLRRILFMQSKQLSMSHCCCLSTTSKLLGAQTTNGGGAEGANTESAEAHLEHLLRNKFPDAATIEVHDISGGCGSMYEVWVEALDFKGLSRVKQHRLITETLAAEIKDMHGLRISTSVPEQ